jgi:hypothetical protein
MHARRNMGMISNVTVMVYGASGVENDIVTDYGSGIYYHTGAYHASDSDLDICGYRTSWMPRNN